jgi:hypothetical protein
MIFRVKDRVIHKDYPGTLGSIVALYGPVVVVLWDEKQLPGNIGNSADLPQRTSRHIPRALEHVQQL